MYTGSLPATSIHGTWLENIELLSILDDTPIDLASITEIVLQLIDPLTRSVELTLKMSSGEITIPVVDQGIIQWRAERGLMGTLRPKTYDALLVLKDATDEVPLILGPISIVE